MTSLYSDLGVEPNDDAATIKRAHRKKARETHPDTGGDREEFERIQRAAVVLTDPARRARYDETGETESRPSNPMAEFAEIIVPAFDAALNEAADRMEMIDIIASTKAKLRQMVSNATVEIGKAKQARERFDKALQRLKFNGDGIDFIGNVLTDRVRQIGKQIEMMEGQRAKVEAAIVHIEVYGWEVTKPDVMQMSMAQMMGSSSSSNFRVFTNL